MARNRIPTVGTKGLHVAQLSPEVRRILAHRAKEAAHREYAPILNADRGAFGVANKTYRSEAQSARGATNAVQSSLAQALAGLKGAGLQGTALQQTRGEFTSRAADAASALPSLLAGAGEERAKALGEAQTQLISDRAQMQSSAAEKLNQTLKETRDKASTVLGNRASEDSSTSEESEGLKNASLELKNWLKWWSGNPTMKDPETGEEVKARKAIPLTSKSDWLLAAKEIVHNGEGFDITEAMQAINRFLKNKQRKLHQGRLPQPGVPYNPSE